jgi:hypothetical protein
VTIVQPELTGPVLKGKYTLLPESHHLSWLEEDPVLKGSQNHHYDAYLPDHLKGRHGVLMLMHNTLAPCCYSSLSYHRDKYVKNPCRPVAGKSLNIDFAKSLAAVSAEWVLCRSPEPTKGNWHVFDNICLIPVSQHDVKACMSLLTKVFVACSKQLVGYNSAE